MVNFQSLFNNSSIMNMKTNKVLLLIIAIFVFKNIGFAQEMEWSKAYGGSLIDVVTAIEKTMDGGFIVAGYTRSNDGDVGATYGGSDAWITKLDHDGNLEWAHNYGGFEDDIALSIKQTADEGYIVAGYAKSNDGDLGGELGGEVGGNHGEHDSWVFKLDSEGTVEWSKNYGGSDQEIAVYIIQTSDSGYAFVSHSESSDVDVGGNNGGRDYWIVKLDHEGNLEWERNYGGSAWDTPSSIREHASGGYIVSGWAGVSDGDVESGNGSNDSWFLKLDAEGNIEWQKNYGGTDSDVTYDFDLTNDGGYIFVGRSQSADLDVAGNNGEHDCWVLKLDSEANVEWSKNFGGSDNEAANAVKQTMNGDYLIVGNSSSNDGDLVADHGAQDCWVMMLDGDGELLWKTVYGGSSEDWAADIIQIGDDEFVAANWTDSNNGDVSGNNGNEDFWITKFVQTTSSISRPDFNSQVRISPNPSNGQFTLHLNNINTPVSVSLIDASGCTVYNKEEVQETLNLGDISKGMYSVQILGEDFLITRKLIVQ